MVPPPHTHETSLPLLTVESDGLRERREDPFSLFTGLADVFSWCQDLKLSALERPEQTRAPILLRFIPGFRSQL